MGIDLALEAPVEAVARSPRHPIAAVAGTGRQPADAAPRGLVASLARPDRRLIAWRFVPCGGARDLRTCG
jgi:hypothetical protein